MNKRNTRKLARMKRAKKFCEDHPVVPPNPVITARITALGIVITAVHNAAMAQDGGSGAVTSAINSRLEARRELRQLMSSLAKAGRRLDKDAYPGVAGKLRMAGTNSYAKLLTRALVFKETIATTKAAFVALGAPAEVDVELAGLIAALQGAGNDKLSNLDTQIGGTLSIEAKVREGIDHVHELDAIFTQLYRKNLVLLAQWIVAKRATPYSNGAEQSAPGGQSGSSSENLPPTAS